MNPYRKVVNQNDGANTSESSDEEDVESDAPVTASFLTIHGSVDWSVSSSIHFNIPRSIK